MPKQLRSTSSLVVVILGALIKILIGSVLDGAIFGLIFGLVVGFFAWLPGGTNVREVVLIAALWSGTFIAFASWCLALAKWWHAIAAERLKRRISEIE